MASLMSVRCKRGGQLRSEVAHLVGVRHQHQRGLLLADEILQRSDNAIRLILASLGDSIA